MSTFGSFAGDDVLVIADRDTGTTGFAASKIHGLMLAPNNCLSILYSTWNDNQLANCTIEASYTKYMVCLAATEYILVAVNDKANTRLLMLAETLPIKEEWTDRDKQKFTQIERKSKRPVPPPADVYPQSALFSTVRCLLHLLDCRDNKKHNESRL